jgi:acetyl-CoA carboxylase/biotin carboxylase 1
MEKAAVRLAKMVGYVRLVEIFVIKFIFETKCSAGTIEYLYNPHDQTFFFLELNPRLQVEHPCTEMITDVNLPACQLQVEILIIN